MNLFNLHFKDTIILLHPLNFFVILILNAPANKIQTERTWGFPHLVLGFMKRSCIVHLCVT